MVQQFHPALYNGCNLLSMLGLKLIYVCKTLVRLATHKELPIFSPYERSMGCPSSALGRNTITSYQECTLLLWISQLKHTLVRVTRLSFRDIPAMFTACDMHKSFRCQISLRTIKRRVSINNLAYETIHLKRLTCHNLSGNKMQWLEKIPLSPISVFMSCK